MYIAGVLISLIASVLLLVYRQDPLSAFAYATLWPFGILLLPRLLYRKCRARVKPLWHTHMERIVFVLLVSNVPGTVYFHTFGPQYQYDRFQHVLGGFLTSVFLVLMALAITKNAARTRTLLVRLFMLAAVLQIGWEGFQSSSDRLIGSEMFLDGTQDIRRDATEDVTLGLVGIAVSIPYVRRMLRSPNRYLLSST